MKSRISAFFNANTRFRFIAEIGSGGVGEVIQAEDLILKKIVAIKLLSSDISEKAGVRLQKEATAAGSLSHPNITKVLDFNITTDGTPYLVMEFIEGENLSSLLERKNRLEPEEALPLFMQLAQALVYAHQRGVTHRDLKPSNIMLTHDENDATLLKLLDFGLAKKQNDSQYFTTTGAIVGSPIYMSPEQAEGKKVEASSDIYSFGCLMFETLAGQPPYRGNTVLETLSMHKSREIKIPFLDTVLSDTAANHELARLVFWCMQKEKEDRPDASQLLKQLNSIASGETGHKAEDLEIPQKKQPHFKTLILVILILLPTLLVLFEFINKPANQVSSQKQTEQKTKKAESESKSESKTSEKFRILQADPLVIQTNSDANFSDQDLAQFQNKRVEKIILTMPQMNGTGFIYLKDSHLIALDIKQAPLSDQGLQCLSQIQTLKDLDLLSHSVSADGLEHLKKLKKLETLKLNCENLSEKNLCSVASLPKLANLEITSADISTKALAALCSIRSLHNLGLFNSKIHSDANRILPSSNLNEVALNYSTEITPPILLAFGKSNLSNLALEGQNLSAEHFQAISKIPNLQHLNLNKANFNPDDLSILTSATNLKTLKLNEIRETPDSLFKTISKLKLADLHLDETTITDKQLFSLLKMRTLQQIHLENCPHISTQACGEFQNSFRSIWKHDCIFVLKSQYE